MRIDTGPGAAIFVIPGGLGDLTRRKLIPALYSLFRDGRTSREGFAILGVDREEISDDSFRAHLREGVDQFARGKPDEDSWRNFAARLSYLKADLADSRAFLDIGKRLAAYEKEWGTPANHIFYLAIPPAMIRTVVDGLARAKLNKDGNRARIVVEKPFAHDLDSARKLNALLAGVFQESQIFRIDHYLGKETVQNILAFRFANTIFEPIWNRHYIDHVQITVAEQIGVEHRGGYYDHAGALRDMIQNHLMQLLCLIAMEAPISSVTDEVRNKKVDVLHAIRPIAEEQVKQVAVRGQYGSGWIEGGHVPAYRSEPDVAPGSNTDTFAAVKLFVDNWRWQDVPFYLRTGKRLPLRVSEVCIQFRPVPHQTFPPSALRDRRPNRLLIAVQPVEGILLRFEVKQPGLGMYLTPVMMQFFYREAFKIEPPAAYETLLMDIMKGDATLFMRADQTEAAWAIIAPILDLWESEKPGDFPNYPAGSWGPESAEILIAQDGRTWVAPTMLQCTDDMATCHVVTE